MTTLFRSLRSNKRFQTVVATLLIVGVLSYGLYAGDLLPDQLVDDSVHGISAWAWSGSDFVEQLFIILVHMVGYSL